MTTRRNRGSRILAALLLMGSACASGTAAAPEGGDAPAAGAAVVVNVTNHYNGPVEIYAASAGTSYRLGTVHPGFARRFVLRQAMVGTNPVEFVASVGGATGTFRSDRLLVAPGAVVDFVVGRHRVLTTVTLRP